MKRIVDNLVKGILYILALIPFTWIYGLVFESNYKIQMILLSIQFLAVFLSGLYILKTIKRDDTEL